MLCMAGTLSISAGPIITRWYGQAPEGMILADHAERKHFANRLNLSGDPCHEYCLSKHDNRNRRSKRPKVL
jgi:hypothetical protein